MLRRSLLLFAVLYALFTSAFAADLVYLNTPEGEQRLMSAQLRQPFFAMQPYVETQQNLAFCGPASIVAVMNSLGTPRPFDARLYPYRYYTQDNIFNADTQRVKSFIGVSVSGMTLAEIAEFFNALGVKATLTQPFSRWYVNCDGSSAAPSTRTAVTS